MTRLLCACFLFFAIQASAQPKRVLYITHSAGYRHDSILVSIPVLQSLSPRLAITPSEDLSLLTAETLRKYDAVLFFTSGELALSESQRTDLLEFVRRGGGFGGVHSATDTLYSWSGYGDLIGGYFDGHPWVQQVRIDVEDPEHPAAAHLAPAFTLVEEIYQFRDFRRDRVRVLMSLDPTSVSLTAPGVHPDTQDFPLAWVRAYGEGRVFYSALGHFDETWRDPRFQRSLEGALLWLTRQADSPAAPRPIAVPSIAAVGNAANGTPRNTVAAGSLISIYGAALSSGSTAAGSYATRVLGTSVRLAGTPLQLLYVSPEQINARVPPTDLPESAVLDVSVPGAASASSLMVRAAPETAAVFAVIATPQTVMFWTTGLGKSPGTLYVRIGGIDSAVTFAGDAPGFPGLNQISVSVSDGVPRGPQQIEIGFRGRDPFYSAPVTLPAATN